MTRRFRVAAFLSHLSGAAVLDTLLGCRTC